MGILVFSPGFIDVEHPLAATAGFLLEHPCGVFGHL